MSAQFSANLSFIRKERHITQKDAATALGISQALLSHYENGIRECNPDFLIKASAYYGVSADTLLGINGKTQDKPDKPRQATPEEAVIKNLSQLVNQINSDFAGNFSPAPQHNPLTDVFLLMLKRYLMKTDGASETQLNWCDFCLRELLNGLYTQPSVLPSLTPAVNAYIEQRMQQLTEEAVSASFAPTLSSYG